MELTFSWISLGVSLSALLLTLIAWKRSSVPADISESIGRVEIANRAHEARMKAIEMEWDKFATALRRVEGKCDRARRGGTATEETPEPAAAAPDYDNMDAEAFTVVMNRRNRGL